jgi:hypothetical protein
MNGPSDQGALAALVFTGADEEGAVHAVLRFFVWRAILIAKLLPKLGVRLTEPADVFAFELRLLAPLSDERRGSDDRELDGRSEERSPRQRVSFLHAFTPRGA